MFSSKQSWNFYWWIIIVCSLVLIGCGMTDSQSAPPTVAAVSTFVPPPTVTATPDLNWQTDWLHGIPCTLPCFIGITPGTTTVAEALTLLEQNPSINPASIRVHHLAPQDSSIETRWNTGQAGPSLSYTFGVTSTQMIDGINTGIPSIHQQEVLDSHSNDVPPIILQDLLTAFGEPTNIVASESTSIQESESHQLIVSYSIIFVYRSYGMIVDVLLDDWHTKPELTPRFQITAPLIVPADDAAIETFLAKWGIDSAIILPWQGWQDFDFYCRNKDTGDSCR